MELADLDLNKTYTYADYYKWQFEERVELIKGKIFKVGPTPNPVHQQLLGDIFTLLKTFLPRKPCKVFFAPFDVRLTDKSMDDKDIITVLQPDICVVFDRTKVDKRGCIGAPDLVVEVLSPGNSAKELRNKYEVYEEAGVKEYWVVSPQNQNFLIYTLHDGKFQLSPVKMPGDVVTSFVLPGFSIDLTELFSDIDPEEA
jgi:Uma2 family endonuclease